MIHRRLLGAAYVALAVAGAVSAQAADLPTRKEAPAPVFVPPAFTWTGFYVGVNAGGVWSNGGTSTTVFADGLPIGTISGVAATLADVFPGSNFGGSQTGFIGGGQAGYNWQTGAFVFGVETDFDGTTLSRSRSVIGPSFVEPVFGLTDFFTADGSVKLDWLGSTRGRIGYAFFPGQSPPRLRHGRRRLRRGRRSRTWTFLTPFTALTFPLVAGVVPGSVGRSEAAWNMHSPTIGSSAAP